MPHWNYYELLEARNKHIISDDEYYKICTSPSDYYVQAIKEINNKVYDLLQQSQSSND